MSCCYITNFFNKYISVLQADQLKLRIGLIGVDFLDDKLQVLVDEELDLVLLEEVHVERPDLPEQVLRKWHAIPQEAGVLLAESLLRVGIPGVLLLRELLAHLAQSREVVRHVPAVSVLR